MGFEVCEGESVCGGCCLGGCVDHFGYSCCGGGSGEWESRYSCYCVSVGVRM